MPARPLPDPGLCITPPTLEPCVTCFSGFWIKLHGPQRRCLSFTRGDAAFCQAGVGCGVLRAALNGAAEILLGGSPPGRGSLVPVVTAEQVGLVSLWIGNVDSRPCGLSQRNRYSHFPGD